MDSYPINYNGYHLLHAGTIAFMDIEEYGVKIDLAVLKEKLEEISKEIKTLKKYLMDSPEGRVWKKLYPQTMTLKSGTQLKRLLYKEMGYSTKVTTETGAFSSSEEALKHIKSDFVANYIKYIRAEKISTTFLNGIRDETIDGILHPFFNLNTVVTYRSSSSSINFQNLPTRDENMKKYIREIIVPREGFLFTEIDYSGMEVRGAACYHKDPNMIEEICDPSRDMHRDIAQECFVFDESTWSKIASASAKEIRQAAKGGFVFAQFYGDYYEHCAHNLWESALRLKGIDDIPLRTHLKENGLGTLAAFTKHIKKIEERFWNNRFKVYNEWRKDWYKSYIAKGYFDTLTGFRCSGRMKRNNAINYAVQGSSFHCLLWGLIHLHKYLQTNNLKTKIIGQIHDSIVLEIWPEEANKVLAVANDLMTVELRKQWDWLIIPLEIEIEMAPLNQAWYYKKEIVESNKCATCGFCYKYKDNICPVCGKRRRKAIS